MLAREEEADVPFTLPEKLPMTISFLFISSLGLTSVETLPAALALFCYNFIYVFTCFIYSLACLPRFRVNDKIFAAGESNIVCFLNCKIVKKFRSTCSKGVTVVYFSRGGGIGS